MVPAKDFESLSWVASMLGGRFIIAAGRGLKDHLRGAIQSFSDAAAITRVYTRTGWVEIGGSWYYLHSGGAIGADGADPSIKVDLSEYNLSNFSLPDPPDKKAL